MHEKEVKGILTQVYADFALGVAVLAFMDAVIGFLLGRIITLFFSLDNLVPALFGYSSDLWLPFCLALLIVLKDTFYYCKHFNLDHAQTKIPGMQEMLATAKDSLKEKNIVADAFRQQVILTAMRSSSWGLLPLQRIGGRAIALLAVAFVFLIIPYFSILFTDVSDFIEFDRLVDRLTNRVDFDDLNPVELQDDQGIYGDVSSFSSGNNNLELTIDLGVGGGDLTNPLAWQNEISGDLIRDTSSVNAFIDAPAIEQLPQEYLLAKAYNLKIKKLR